MKQYVDSVMSGTDADIVPRLVEFYHGGDPVLDVTFGAGRFWRKTQPPSLISLDHLADADILGDNRQLPIRTESIGTLVYDPPHIRSGRPNSDPQIHDGGIAPRYRTGWVGAESDFEPFLREAVRVLHPKGILIAKLADELLRWPWNHVQLICQAQEVGLRPFDLIIKKRHPSIRNTKQKQWRARRRHCFYVVCKRSC